MNTWDFPFYLLLMGVAFMLYRARTAGWSSARFWELVGFGVLGGILSVVAYLPFYLSFSSQAGGVIPSLAFFTKGKYFWIMFGPLLLPIFGFLISKIRRNFKTFLDTRSVDHGIGISGVVRYLAGLWGFSAHSSRPPRHCCSGCKGQPRQVNCSRIAS